MYYLLVHTNRDRNRGKATYKKRKKTTKSINNKKDSTIQTAEYHEKRNYTTDTTLGPNSHV